MFGGDKSRQFQQGIDPMSLRRNREADRLNLRKKAREEQLQRKRRQIMNNGPVDNDNNKNSDSLSNSGSIDVKSVKLSLLNTYIAEMQCASNINKQIHGLICVRILLSQPDNPPIQEILQLNVLPILLSFFERDDNLKLQFEAAWAVTNLCSSDFCLQVCTEHETISAFVALLKSTKHHEIMDQAVWGLGNIAGENEKFKNQVIRGEVLQFLISRVEMLSTTNYQSCSNVLWCISNLVRCHKNDINDLCPWQKMRFILPVFERLLNDLGGRLKKYKIDLNGGVIQQNDPTYNNILKCVTDSIWCIQYSQIYIDREPSSTYLADIFDTSIIDMFIYFMQMDSVTLTSPSLRVLGTFISGEDEVIKKILKKGYLKSAMLNLGCKIRNIRKEVCWTLSNIAGGDKELILELINFEMGQLIKMVINSCVYDDDQVKKEAGWILANIISCNDDNVIHFLIEKGVINALKFVMKTASIKKPLVTCIEAFDIICNKGKSRDGGDYDYISKVEEAGCVEIFDILQAGVDTDDKVYISASGICKKYWPEDESNFTPDTDHNHNKNNDEDDDMAPQQQHGQFAFGINNGRNHTRRFDPHHPRHRQPDGYNNHNMRNNGNVMNNHNGHNNNNSSNNNNNHHNNNNDNNTGNGAMYQF